MVDKILITSALPYVNNVPHLGNIIGCVLPADVLARYNRQQGRDVLYICGADEYGTCTEVRAREEGVLPRELCDKYLPLHKEIYEWFNISFDFFGRTSTPDPLHDIDWIHTQIAQDIFIKLADNGFLIEQEITQLYSEDLQTFVSDRFVIGTCPHCGYLKANGDQCDGCSQLLNAIELVDPKYKLDVSFPLIKRITEHLFLDLPTLTELLTDWYDVVKPDWSKVATDVTDSWLVTGLKPRCITRDIKWGTPVPDTKAFGDKYSNKIMYNWFDAPIGYISITAQHTPTWRDWWLSDNVRLIQTYAKDNCPFHTIVFPSSLLGTGDKYVLAENMNASHYLNYQGGKFSKSNGIGVFGDDAMESGIPADVWRFYLLIQRPEDSDTEFTWDDFQAKINNILIANFGNFINRVLSMAYKTFDGVVPPLDRIEDDDQQYIDYSNEKLSIYHDLMDKGKLRDALGVLLNITRKGNKYLVATEPWKLWNPYPKKNRPVIDVDRDRAGTVLNVALHIVATLSRAINPFLPTVGDRILAYVNNGYHYNDVRLGVLTGDLVQPKILVRPLSNKLIAALKFKHG